MQNIKNTISNLYSPVNPTFLRHIKHLFLLVFAFSFVSEVLASASASGCLKLSLSVETLLVDDDGLTSATAAAAARSSLAGK